jgi:hypothetical protein
VADTTLSADAFQSLPSTYSTSAYLPLVLHDPSTGAHEKVWVTNHAAGSVTVTVARGREGTNAQPWNANTQIIDAATVRDLVADWTSALPTDAHTGQRGYRDGIVLERTPGGFGASVGLALPADVGPLLARPSNYPPAGVVIQHRSGYFDGVADAGGNIRVNFRAQFPVDIISFTATSTVLNCLGPYVIYGWDRQGVNLRCFSASPTPVGDGTIVRCSYQASGY